VELQPARQHHYVAMNAKVDLGLLSTRR
jgi:hypothetical protein